MKNQKEKKDENKNGLSRVFSLFRLRIIHFSFPLCIIYARRAEDLLICFDILIYQMFLSTLEIVSHRRLRRVRFCDSNLALAFSIYEMRNESEINRKTVYVMASDGRVFDHKNILLLLKMFDLID